MIVLILYTCVFPIESVGSHTATRHDSHGIGEPVASIEQHVTVNVSDTSVVEEGEDHIDQNYDNHNGDCESDISEDNDYGSNKDHRDNDSGSDEEFDSHTDRDSDCISDEDHENNENQNYDNEVEEESNHQSIDYDDDVRIHGRNLKQPLYNGTDLTTCAAVCLIMQFSLRYNLTNQAIEKLLKLLYVLLPSPNHLPKSYYKLKAFFKQFSVPYNHSEICTMCNNNTENCHCQFPSRTTGHLLQISIIKPLSAVISKHWKSLQFFSNNTDGILRDVWDGLYIKTDSNDDSSRKTIYLLVSTDGVPLYKSSTVSLWPVSFIILNLPPTIRMNSENIILSGFWVGSKPIMRLLFAPILDNLSQLESSGLEIRTSSVIHYIFVKLAMGIFDLPAKAAVLNAKQFNGKYGCSVCMHPGNRLSNNSRIYPPHHYRERTHADILHNAETAEKNKVAVKGIIGASPLGSVLNLVDAIPVDYMHCVLQGIVKMLLTRWFDSSYHNQLPYLGRQVSSVDMKFLKQRPPTEFSRPPRSIQKHLKYWKASELRNWLLFYSLPILLDHLPSLYWHHYSLLVCSMHLLLSDAISPVLIDAAEQMLADFYLLIQELYGDSACTHNVHLLVHLPKYVRLWGPLWTHSTFGFESKNGHLKKYFHGRNAIHQQLIFNSDAFVTLQFLQSQIVQDPKFQHS